MNTIKYKSSKEAIAAVKLSIARKKEWMARVEREWAEQELKTATAQ